ncbi:hypothetical protein F4861DRAFT_249445 [Xylaria intraflava]|nr:hypothetical protein F4861DRAFT_249445 [Xylaria intraflava]
MLARSSRQVAASLRGLSSLTRPATRSRAIRQLPRVRSASTKGPDESKPQGSLNVSSPQRKTSQNRGRKRKKEKKRTGDQLTSARSSNQNSTRRSTRPSAVPSPRSSCSRSSRTS